MKEVDYFSYTGALVLKNKITDYWKKRGLDAGVRIEIQTPNNLTQPIYVVRSNIRFDEKGYPYEGGSKCSPALYF